MRPDVVADRPCPSIRAELLRELAVAQESVGFREAALALAFAERDRVLCRLGELNSPYRPGQRFRAPGGTVLRLEVARASLDDLEGFVLLARSERTGAPLVQLELGKCQPLAGETELPLRLPPRSRVQAALLAAGLTEARGLGMAGFRLVDTELGALAVLVQPGAGRTADSDPALWQRILQALAQRGLRGVLRQRLAGPIAGPAVLVFPQPDSE